MTRPPPVRIVEAPADEDGTPPADPDDAPGFVVPQTMIASVGLVASVVRELTGAKRLDTILGQQILKLAIRLENSTVDTGSSVAALSRELRALRIAALAGADIEDDEIDELQKRRDAKQAAAASKG